MDDGWASTMILRRDEECVRNANAPSCPLLEEGMSATCIGIDRYTDRRHEDCHNVGSRPAKHVELEVGVLESASPLCHWHLDGSLQRSPHRWKAPVNSVSRRLGLSLKRSGNACTDLKPIRPGIYSVCTMVRSGRGITQPALEITCIELGPTALRWIGTTCHAMEQLK